MAEKPEDLNLPNAVISRLAKDAVRIFDIPLFSEFHMKFEPFAIQCVVISVDTQWQIKS